MAFSSLFTATLLALDAGVVILVATLGVNGWPRGVLATAGGRDLGSDGNGIATDFRCLGVRSGSGFDGVINFGVVGTGRERDDAVTTRRFPSPGPRVRLGVRTVGGRRTVALT